MTFDLRRLREHGLIERLPRSNWYRITDGLRVALLIIRVQGRVLPTGLAHLLGPVTQQHPLRAAARAHQAAVDELHQEIAT